MSLWSYLDKKIKEFVSWAIRPEPPAQEIKWSAIQETLKGKAIKPRHHALKK